VLASEKMFGFNFKIVVVNRKTMVNKKSLQVFYFICIQIRAVAPLYLSNPCQYLGNRL